MGEKKNKIWQHGLKPKEQNMKHLNNNLNSKRWNNIPTYELWNWKGSRQSRS